MIEGKLDVVIGGERSARHNKGQQSNEAFPVVDSSKAVKPMNERQFNLLSFR
jgi:hypothetical protein